MTSPSPRAPIPAASRSACAEDRASKIFVILKKMQDYNIDIAERNGAERSAFWKIYRIDGSATGFTHGKAAQNPNLGEERSSERLGNEKSLKKKKSFDAPRGGAK